MNATHPLPHESTMNFRCLRAVGVACFAWSLAQPLAAQTSMAPVVGTEADGDGTSRFRHDAGTLLDSPATNVFMIKLNYWLNL